MGIKLFLILACAIGFIACICEDAKRESEKGYCKQWKEGGYCETQQKVMELYCRKTCGFCKDGEENGGCEDAKRESEAGFCKLWHEAGYCVTQKKQMELYCRKTCGYCKYAAHIPDFELCEDAKREGEAGYCKLWKDAGYCGTEKEKMTLYCRKTCGYCN